MSKVLRTAAVIVGAVALVATGVGAVAVAGTAIAATAASVASIATLASTALTLGVALTAKKPGAQATGSQTTFSADPDAGIPWVIGRTGTAGNITFRVGFDTGDKGDNDRQSFVSTLSLGPIAAIESFQADRATVSFIGGGAAIGTYAGFMWQRSQLGMLPEASALGFGAGAGSPPGWTAQHKLSGKAAASWTLRFDTKAKLYQNGVPAPMWIVRGALCYDPTKDSTYPGGSGSHRMADPAETAAYDAAMDSWEYTENPYLVGLRFAHGVWQRDRSTAGSKYQRVMGMGANWAAIDVGAFVEGRNIAQANGWKVGGVIYSGDGKWDSLKKILQAGMGEPLALGARISCLVNSPKVSLATITIDDVVGAASVSATQPRRDRINTITPRYRLEENNWQLLPGSPISVAEHVAEDRGKRSKVQDYPFIQQTSQVGTAVRYDIENAREFGPIVLPLKLFWMGYKPGDCVTAELPELGLVAQPILLLNRELDPSGGITTMTARSETAAKHAFALGQTATPPPTPGVTGATLVPVPAQEAWRITATGLVSDNVVVPALVVEGVVDIGTAEAIVFEYRPYVDGQGADAAWASVGTFSPDTVRQDIVSVRGGTSYEVAISYLRRGVLSARRVIGPVITGGVALDYDAVTGPTRPDNNATNSADPNSPFGPGTVREAIATLGEFVPLKADTEALKDAQALLDAAVEDLHDRADVATDALAALDVDIADSDAARRQLERDAGRVSDTLLQLLLGANDTRAMLRDAGIYVDPNDAKVRIYSVDQLGARTNLVEQTFDAQRALIASKASSNEVDEKILRAVLNPEQVAQLEPLIARIAAVEIIQDGLRADISLKADLIELTKTVARVTTAEQKISAAEGLIETRVERTVFDGAIANISQAIQRIEVDSDRSAIIVELRQARADNVEAGAGLLSSVVAANEANNRLITAIGGARQELYTKITGVGADLEVESRARTLLEAEVGSLDARSVQDRLTLVRANEALAQDIDALGTQNETQEANITTLQRSSLTLAGGVAGIETSIRQQARGAGLSDAALLADVLGGDEATRRLNNSLAEIQTQLTTTLVAGFAASAVARETLRARIDQADARFAQEVSTTADRFKAVTQALTVLDAAFADPTNGLAATAAQIARLERTTAEQNTATVELITGLRAIVNDPASGLLKTSADLTALTTAVADQNRAAISRLEGLEATVNDGASGLAATVAKLNRQIELSAERDNARAIEISQLAVELHDPATGLPAVRATATADRQASVTRDNANARSVEQVTARLDGVGEVGIEQAIGATVNRLGLIEAQASLVFDVNGNLFGWKIIGGAEGPASFNLINTDFRMGTGRVIFNNGTFMKVQGVGFGVARDLLDWFGPTMALDQCSRANAISYEATDGDKYTGGSFSAGTLKNASASSGLGTAEVAEIGPFGSNGKPVKYVVSWSYRTQSTRTFAATPEGLRQYRDTAASYNATDDYGVLQVEHPASTITLTRAFSGGAFAQIDQRSFTTETQTFVGSPPSPGDGPGRADFTTTIGGGFTVNDPNQIANDRTVRLALARGFTSAGDAVSQRLTIVAIEE